MALITPIELQRRIQMAIRNTPRLIEEQLQKTDFVAINQQNLMEGKDSFGNDLPRYKILDYAHFKTSINPKNRGFWDLRVTGEYQSYISVNIKPAIVFFKNNMQGEKAVWLNQRLHNRHIGITEEQIKQIQIDNKPIIKEKIFNIINKGTEN